MKKFLFHVDEQLRMTEQEVVPADFLPVSKFHECCKWARTPLLSVIRAFHYSSYFQILPTAEFKNAGREVVLEILPGSRSSQRYKSTIVATMGHYHLRVTIQSKEESNLRFQVKKEWRRGYTNRPKWRKFGFYACQGLQRHHVLKDIEHIMES